jgi:inorganic triphosphatase YgiF
MSKQSLPLLESESELKVIPLRELQIKLLASLRGDSSEYVVQILTKAFQLGDYHIAHIKRAPIIDEYLDTDDFVLFRTKRTLRVRRKDAKLTVTTKELKGFSVGEFHRDETNWDIDDATYEEQLVKGFDRFRPALRDIGERPMNVKLKVTNERDSYLMKGSKDEYELVVDIFSYANPLTGQYSVQQFEVEVEAKNKTALARLPTIKENLIVLLSKRANEFQFSEDTKYERGVKLLGLLRPTWMQHLSAWATNSNASLLNLLLGLMGLAVAIAGIAVAFYLVK